MDRGHRTAPKLHMNTDINHPSPDMEELFHKSGDDLLRYFSRRHGESEIAKDLLQETFAQFAKRRRDGSPLESARGYLFGIARHLSQNVWTRRRQEMVLPLDEESAGVAAPVPDERIAAARETIASLSSLQREILDLRFSQGLSYAEMAEALGIPAGTVRSRLHNAVAELRSRIESDNIPLHSKL